MAAASSPAGQRKPCYLGEGAQVGIQAAITMLGVRDRAISESKRRQGTVELLFNSVVQLRLCAE